MASRLHFLPGMKITRPNASPSETPREEPQASPQPLPPPLPPEPPDHRAPERLRALEHRRNYDFSGLTGGAWDVVHATNFQSDNAAADALLRQINHSVAGAAAVLNVVNNAAGFVLVDAPRALEDGLVAVGGPSFEELAVAARSATPGMPLDDLAGYGLARIAQLSRRVRLRIKPSDLRLGPEAFKHIQKRHLDGWPARLPKSLFFPNVDLEKLLKQAAKVPRSAQRGGNYERIVEGARYVGIDRRSLEPTAVYSVITTPQDRLVTMFPGKP
ncbi:hypothetical protein FBR05_07025 [Deltaproteobacteria bacterium PRO3]|nr:hypothetical protein [Deltaproteobacteria bacterium PRO3]